MTYGATIPQETDTLKTPSGNAVIVLDNVHKTYDLGEVQVHALRGVSLESIAATTTANCRTLLF